MPKLSSLTVPVRAVLLTLLSATLFISCTSKAGVQNGNGNSNGNGNGIGHGVGHGNSKPETKQSPQPELNPGEVETRLSELIYICKDKRVEDAAPYYVYRGPDQARKWKDTMRAGDPLEKAALEEHCREINRLVESSNNYIFGEVKVERESEGEWHALEVSFHQKDGGIKKVIFAFLLINGQFAIGDIDQ